MSACAGKTPRMLHSRPRRDLNRLRRSADQAKLLIIEQARTVRDQAGPAEQPQKARAYLRLRDAFVGEKLGLAREYAKRWVHRDLEFEDLTQVASMGLVEAIDRWRSDKAEGGFSSWAILWMRDALQQHLRKVTAVTVPYSLHRKGELIERTERRLGPGHTLAELAAATGLSEAQIEEAKAAPRKSFRTDSLEARVEYPDGSTWEYDRRPADDERPETYEEELITRLDLVRSGPINLDADATEEPPAARPSAKLRAAAKARAARKVSSGRR